MHFLGGLQRYTADLFRDEVVPDDGVGSANAYARDDGAQLPDTPSAAIELFRESELAARAFGADVVAHLARFAEDELEAARMAVTDVERRRLFHI